MTALLRRAGGGVNPLLAIALLAAALTLPGSARAQTVPVPDPEPPAAPPLVPIAQSNAPPPPYATPAATPPVKTAPVPLPDGPAVGPSLAAGRYSFVLSDGTRLVGVPGDVKTLPFDAIFGHIEIPMASIRSVEVTTSPGGKVHRVQFINGDALTGSVGGWPAVRVHTAYGELTIPLASLVRMSTDGFAEARTWNETPPTVADKPKTAVQATLTGRPVPVPFDDAPPGPIRPVRADLPIGDPE